MSEEPKLKKADVEALYVELEQLEHWTNPKPDPGQWPPEGYAYHPQMPGHLYRIVSEDDLREEVFGSERKTEWLKQAAARIAEIKDTLAKVFFPKAKEEGTERKQKFGFAVMLKTALDRKFDIPALAPVVAECQKISNEKKLGVNVEATVIDWKPSLKLKEFRELPAPLAKQFQHALIVTPKKPEFEIVRVAEEDA